MKLLVFFALVSSTAAYRFLVIIPVPTGSHSILGAGVVNSLVKAGHEVTYVTAFPSDDPPEGVRLVDVSFMKNSWASLLPNYFQKEKEPSMSEGMAVLFNTTKSLVKSDVIQSLLLDTSQQFDAVIAEWFFSDVFSGFAQVFQCPYILLSPLGMGPTMEYLMDEVQSPATNPLVMLGFTTPMSLKERLINSIGLTALLAMTIFLLHPKEAVLYQECFGPAAAARGIELADYSEAIRDISMLLINSHPSIGRPTRLPPNAVEIGGFHIENDTKPLPKDLQELLDKSTNGVIYFSMGSNVKSKDMPEELRNELLEMFGRFPQTVLWKFEAEMKNAPKNVHVRPWMPQQSILAHKNIKVFITHGGISSTTEAIHYGVPVIAIPAFGDQHVNAMGAVKRGYGLMLELQDPYIVYNLEEALNKMLDDPRYGDTARLLSQLYHDRPVPPARLVSYWSEHVVRTGGAPHLRTAASLVPAYQRYLLDILAILVATLLLSLWLLRTLFRLIFKRKSSVAMKKRKNK